MRTLAVLNRNRRCNVVGSLIRIWQCARGLALETVAFSARTAVYLFKRRETQISANQSNLERRNRVNIILLSGDEIDRAVV